MRKLFINIIIISVLGAGLGMGYVWYNSKKQIDQAIEQMAVVANVRYSSLFVSPFGALSLNGVRITPHDSYSDFTIETLRLQAPDLWRLINLQDDLRQGNIPESLQLSAEQITIPIYALPLDNASASAPSGTVAFAALGCGGIADFGVDEYLAMGYESFVLDQTLAYRYDKRSGNLVLNSRSSVADSADIGAEFVFSLPAADETQDDSSIGPFPIPKLVRGQFLYTDQAFNQRRNDFCANQAGVSTAAYIDQHIELARQFLASVNILPSEGLVSVYRDFIGTDGGNIDFQFAPAEELDFGRLALYPPHQILSLLQPRLSVNGTTADDISLSFIQNAAVQEQTASSTAESGDTLVNNLNILPDTAAVNPESEQTADQSADQNNATASIPSYEPASSLNELPAGTTADPVETAAAVTPQPAPNSAAARTRVIAQNEIAHYLGRTATVRMAAGKQYDGQLIDADNTALQLKVKLRGGEVGYWLNFSDISEIQLHE